MIENRLRIIMSERYLSSTKLSKITGLSRNTVNSLKNNKLKMIRFDTLDILCQALDITPNDFFKYTKEE